MNASVMISPDAGLSTVDFLIGAAKQIIKSNVFVDKDGVQRTDWSADTIIEEAGIDSFDFVEMIFLIEDHYGIEIEHNANKSLNEIKTIGELAMQIDALVAGRRAA